VRGEESRAGGQRSGAVAGRQAGRHETGMCTVMAGRQAGRQAVDRRLAPKARLAAPTCPKYSCAPETSCIRSWVVMSSLYCLGLYNPDRIIRSSSSVPTMNQITSNKHYWQKTGEQIGSIAKSHSHCSKFTLLNPIHIALLANPSHIALLDQSHSHRSLGPIPFTLL
jgi:hypothetical protein